MEPSTSTDHSSHLNMKYEVDANSEEGADAQQEVRSYTGQDLESQCFQDDVPDSIVADSIARARSRRMTGVEELYREASNCKDPMPKMGAGKDYPPMLPSRDPYAVAFDGPDDPEFPQNWPLKRKILNSFSVALCALAATIGSAMFSQGTLEVMKEFHVGSVVVALGTSLFVFGFAAGPILWGPLSELYGRKTVLMPSSFGYICFSFAVGSAKDIQTVMICRFFAGFMGAASLVTAPASMADIFSPVARGKAITIFAMTIFGGPMLAPILGGFIVKNHGLGWRWTSYFSGLIGVLSFLSVLFLLEETHHGLILVKKAEVLRRRTGNWGIHAAHEEVSLSIKEIVEKNIARPIVMLVREPILFLISLYNAFIYGILYLCLTAIPLIFAGEYGFSQGVAELPYLSMLIGIFIGGGIGVFMEKRFIKAMEKNGGKIVAEERLPPMMVGAVSYTIGLFWLGWTGAYAAHVHWIVPTIGAAPLGIGLILLFLPALNYIIDCYLFFAASAIAGNTFLRSAFGAAFPLFARQMFVDMKIQWAATLLGCVSLALVPVPFLFYKYGKSIRAKSKFAF